MLCKEHGKKHAWAVWLVEMATVLLQQKEAHGPHEAAELTTG